MSDATRPATISGTVRQSDNITLKPGIGHNRPRPNRKANDALRPRKHLLEAEVEQLMKAAKAEGRYGHRDATAIMLAFRHGLRVAELVGLQWQQFDLARGTVQINRVKSGDPSTHYLNGVEMRALRQLQRDWPNSRYLFVSERGDPVTTAWFRKMLARLGRKAEMPFPINPHMLRHGCGFMFANAGKDTRSLQGFLGHRNAQSTVIYTSLAPGRFKGWENT
jgi:integrase